MKKPQRISYEAKASTAVLVGLAAVGATIIGVTKPEKPIWLKAYHDKNFSEGIGSVAGIEDALMAPDSIAKVDAKMTKDFSDLLNKNVPDFEKLNNDEATFGFRKSFNDMVDLYTSENDYNGLEGDELRRAAAVLSSVRILFEKGLVSGTYFKEGDVKESIRNIHKSAKEGVVVRDDKGNQIAKGHISVDQKTFLVDKFLSKGR